jgi:hypothetical protein
MTIGPALRTARRSVGVVTMILTPAEVRATSIVFPTKFLDIQDHHIVLHGDDPFVGLAPSREHIRLRILQQLHNLTLRLRARFCAGFDDPGLLAEMLTNLARPLAVELAALLKLAGKETPSEDRTAAIFHAASKAFNANGDALDRLAALRHGQPINDDLPTLFAQTLTSLTRFTEAAEHLKETVA